MDFLRILAGTWRPVLGNRSLVARGSQLTRMCERFVNANMNESSWEVREYSQSKICSRCTKRAQGTKSLKVGSRFNWKISHTSNLVHDFHFEFITSTQARHVVSDIAIINGAKAVPPRECPRTLGCLVRRGKSFFLE